MKDAFLDNVSVVELGQRLSVGLCGGLLQRLGAKVLAVELANNTSDRASKWAHGPALTAGKQVVQVNSDDQRELAALADVISNANVILTSSDDGTALDTMLKEMQHQRPVLCDITAFGASGPCAGESVSDAMMQAIAGLMDTTGSASGPPITSRVPMTENAAAVFAAAGVLCALRGHRLTADPQRVEIAMFDAAVSMLSTFLPGHFAGATPQRMGNRHPSMSPWNAYPAKNGWVLLCSASNEMWKRVCSVIECPDLGHDPRFTTMPGRVKEADAVDAALVPWIRQHTVHDCVEQFTAAGVPCGPVYTMDELLADTDLQAQGALAKLDSPDYGRPVTVPGPLIRGSRASGVSPAKIPQRACSIHDQHTVPRHGQERPPTPSSAPPGTGVLDGIRVLEMGSYTTAPLAARNLGALGAYVVKLEPPAGELSRASPPHVDGQSYFCTLSNSDKRCVAVDLRTDAGKRLFTQLLERADVFVENMKPGALERFGFDREQIESINPALVYCSVSGFGADSTLAGRPAMDSTIQGMAGIMDLTRADATPYKTGISIADITGGQFALLAVLAGLEYRERAGKGQFIDLSMLEVSAWLTQPCWNTSRDSQPDGRIIKCNDGYVYVEPQTNAADDLAQTCAGMTKNDAARYLAAQGLRCAPVNSVSEVAAHPQTLARELIVQGVARDGRSWPLLACPIQLRPQRAVVQRAIGAVGADLREVLNDWGMDMSAEC